MLSKEINFQKNTADINNRKFFYWEKNKKHKEILILLHGFPGSHNGLLEMAKGLDDYRLIIPDLPACGLSEDLLEHHNLQNYSIWLKNFLEFLCINEAIIIGHSFGSRVALVFSSNYPDRVKKLILIAPVVKNKGFVAQLATAEHKIAKVLPQQLQRAWLSNALFREISNRILFKSPDSKKRRELIAQGIKDLEDIKPQINIEMFEEFYKFDLTPIVSNIQTKSLIIAGELDDIAPLSSIQNFVKQLNNHELIIMKYCGHIMVAEKPLTTASIIRNWIEQ